MIILRKTNKQMHKITLPKTIKNNKKKVMQGKGKGA